MAKARRFSAKLRLQAADELQGARVRKAKRPRFLLGRNSFVIVRSKRTRNLDDKIEFYLNKNEQLSQRAEAIAKEFGELCVLKTTLEEERASLELERGNLEREKECLEQERASLVRDNAEFEAELRSLRQSRKDSVLRQSNRQSQPTIHEHSLDNEENNSPVFHTPEEAERKASRSRLMDDEQVKVGEQRSEWTEQQRNESVGQTDELDDLIPVPLTPRNFPRQSIGQWSVERSRNNMSVRSLVSSLESKSATRRR